MRTDIDTIYIGGEWITPLSTSRIETRRQRRQRGLRAG